MKKILFIFLIFFSFLQIAKAQKIEYQTGHKSDILEIKLSPDGSKLLSYSWDDGICFWDLKTGQLLWKRNAWVVQKGNEYYTLTSFAFSPDGNTVASGSGNGTVQLWDTKTGSLLWLSDAHRDSVTIVEFLPDGQSIVSAASPKENKDEIKILNASTGRIIKTFEGNSCTIIAVTFDKSGKILKTGNLDGNVFTWDLETGKQTEQASAPPCQMRRTYEWEVSFSADLKFSATRTGEKELTVKNVETGKIVKTLPASGYRIYARFSADNQKIVASTYGGLLFHNLLTGENQEIDDGTFMGAAFELNYDGSLLIKDGSAGRHYIEVLETKNPKKVRKLEGGKITLYQPGEFELKLMAEKKQKLVEIQTALAERERQAVIYTNQNKNKITARFSHYGDAESFWDQRIGETGAPNKSKLTWPKEKASAAWFTLTNSSDLPVTIDTNSIYLDPKCKGLCDGAEISARYVMEMKNRQARVNGIDMYSRTFLRPKMTVYFSVTLEDFAQSKAIYLGFTFQKDNPYDDYSEDYGEMQKLYLPASDLPN